MRLDDKIALVTGAGRGIGKALALGFVKAGAHVIVVSRTQSEIEATAREAQAMGSQPRMIKADISQPHDVQNMANQVCSRFGHLHILVNNAALRMITQNPSERVRATKSESEDGASPGRGCGCSFTL